MEKKMEKVVQVMENCDNFIEKEVDFFRQITLEQEPWIRNLRF